MSIIQIFHMYSNLLQFLLSLQNLYFLFFVNGKYTESSIYNMIFVYHTLSWDIWSVVNAAC